MHDGSLLNELDDLVVNDAQGEILNINTNMKSKTFSFYLFNPNLSVGRFTLEIAVEAVKWMAGLFI